MKNIKSLFFILFIIPFLPSCKKNSIYEPVQQEVVLKGQRLLATTIELKRDTTYLLTENIIRNAGTKLIIEAGTLVKVNGGITITINSGAVIDIKGTPQNPVIFTAATPKGTGGAVASFPLIPNTNWGGIIINGSKGVSSGVFDYVRIEFISGRAGLQLINVDSSTVINNIQVSYAKPLSFIFSGGNVNAGNLVSYACGKTDFVFQNGYTGKMQNILAYRLPFFPDINTAPSSVEAFYFTGASTFPVISNLTVIGTDNQPLRQDAPYFNERSSGLLIEGGSRFHIRNSVIAGYPRNGFYINSAASGLALQNGPSEFTYSFIHSGDSSRAFYIPDGLITANPPVNATTFKNFMLQPRFNNQLVLNTSFFAYTDPYNYNTNPDPQPRTGSPLLSGANFDGPVYSNPFFKKVNYRGAIGTDNWLQGWVNFTPLLTNYNK